MRVDEEVRASLATEPILRLVALAGQILTQRWSKVMSRQHGLTAAGANALSVLAWGGVMGNNNNPGRATHAELARRCWVRPATLTGVVDTLERAGYVRRERDPADRRLVWLALTDEGWRRVQRIGIEMRRSLAPVAAMRDPAQEAVIRAFLIDLITYDDGESDDDEQQLDYGSRGARPDQAIPEA
jgi:DNA-binding MarR family transcriptional regulator